MSDLATAHTGTVLDHIIARTTADVALRKASKSIAVLENMAADRPTPVVSLHQALSTPAISVIAEIKRASPSGGVFPVEVVPAQVANQYLQGGAAAISVLTDGPFFMGSLVDMAETAAIAHAGTPPSPVLRKDFIVDRYQILEAKAHGADAFLLIVAALTDEHLQSFLAFGADCGLDALVEVHDEAELERAVALGATLIGINSRDLRTFEIDLAVTERLAPMLPAGTVIVGESGIFSRDDVVRLQRSGVHAVLVGESLIVAPDRAAAVALLLHEA